MDYNTNLGRLRNKKNDLLEDIKDLDEMQKKELEEAKQLISEKYFKLKQNSYKKFNKKINDIYNYCKLIEEYSTVDSNIFAVLTELISVFEGEHYVLEKLNYHKDKSSPASVWETYMIMPKNVFDNIDNPNYIRERYFHHLKKCGIALTIVEDWSLYYLPNDFTFYEAEEMGRLNPQMSFKGFPYVKEFIDYVINYRLKNKIEELSVDDMNKLKDEFILHNVEKIKDNYKTKKDKKLQESSDSIIYEWFHNEDILKRLVKRIENN